MEEQLISFETAKLSKEKGFWYDGNTNNWLDTTLPYLEDGTRRIDFTYKGEYFSAPTQSLLQKWFRIKHQIFIDILTDQTAEPKFTYQINQFVGNPHDLTEREWYWKETIVSQYLYKTYEECFEEAEQEALKLL